MKLQDQPWFLAASSSLDALLSERGMSRVLDDDVELQPGRLVVCRFKRLFPDCGDGALSDGAVDFIDRGMAEFEESLGDRQFLWWRDKPELTASELVAGGVLLAVFGRAYTKDSTE